MSPAFTCVDDVAGAPFTFETVFTVSSFGTVGFDGLHDEHVPTVEVATFAIV